MPVSFTRLRIAGFKSFPEPVSVEIRPGLTGIVGPNGCGKSNVVEALRWAMGENSARSLRGGEMDDVIFAGTAHRPSRNIAEVAITLEDAAGIAPPPFSEQPELQVSRLIERGSGSTYRVNGREVRARDVQTLYADLASGARSSAMVSQGRVSSIVNARPDERRSILEEAAGITGLHARRHEAEIKLKAAEANLARAEDLKAQLETQLAGLKKQARQAARYRNISGLIRGAEAELFSLQRARVEQGRLAATEAMRGAAAAVAAGSADAAEKARLAEECAAALPALREREAEARTALERAKLAREQITAEEQRARAALAAAEQRQVQIARDLAHAEQLQRDAGAATDRLATEEARLAEADAAHPARAEAAAAALDAAGARVRTAEAEANRATEAAAELSAKLNALQQMLAQAEARLRKANENLARLEEDHRRVAAQVIPSSRLEAAAFAELQADAALAAARGALERAEQAKVAAHAASYGTRERQNSAEAARTRLAAEAQALAAVLGVKDGERWPPMVDALEVPAGLEAALGAALGEELNAAADPNAARHWRSLSELQFHGLPAGAKPLAAIMEAPSVLRRALSGIGLVDDPATAESAQATLAPGQMLVSREGAVWRWDGYTIKAGAPTAAAVRLKQRNRLAVLRRDLAAAELESKAARDARAQSDVEEREAQAEEQRARAGRRDAEQALDRARAEASTLRNQAANAAARLAALDDQLGSLRPERDEAEAALAEARQARAALPDIAGLRAAVERARQEVSSARASESAARTAHEGLAREASGRANRRRFMANEREDWRQRAADAASRVVDLAARARESTTELAALQAAPAAIAERREAAGEALAGAEAEHRATAGALRAASSAAEQADRAARAAEAALSRAREDAVRAEAAIAQANQAWGQVMERILERLGVDPELPAPPADLSAEAEDRARRKLDRLVKERDEMGPVNLRAEIEAEEVETRIANILAERDELATAIAKLRGSIGHLNREGRERLTQVFEQVDKHFQALFARMFGGGRAHLAMVGSDDPLAAGLEIYAQPPGKKLAALSLLSGGEQALTALSLIFAVFLCNPAPVCVLDEVDAPLDDANVDRFCALLEDIVQQTGTRFLVVTHHQMTMARMDRLYGVTMQERGVSRLLSVDLQQAAGIVEPPRERMAAE